jgi:hypothetical protein
MPLIGPARQQRIEADEPAHREVHGLPSFDDGLDNIGSEKGKRKDTADLPVIDTDLSREAGNRWMTPGTELMQPAPGTGDHIEKACIRFGRLLWNIPDDQAGFHSTAA